MSSVIPIRDLDPGDKARLKHEARMAGLSVEVYVRRLIREKREDMERRHKASEVFKRHFGAERGIELPPTKGYRHKGVTFADDTGG